MRNLEMNMPPLAACFFDRFCPVVCRVIAKSSNSTGAQSMHCKQPWNCAKNHRMNEHISVRNTLTSASPHSEGMKLIAWDVLIYVNTAVGSLALGMTIVGGIRLLTTLSADHPRQALY